MRRSAEYFVPLHFKIINRNRSITFESMLFDVRIVQGRDKSEPVRRLLPACSATFVCIREFE